MRVGYLILWHLTVCLEVIARTSLPPPVAYDTELDNGSHGSYPTLVFSTRTDTNFKIPVINFPQWSSECDDGLLTFLTPRGHSLPRPGPLIVDARGELIWGKYFENAFGGQAYNFLVQQYKGEDYLTFWLGDDRVRGHGAGYYYMLNSSYDIVQKIGGANGLSADLHEFTITSEGTALMTLYEIIPGNVTMFREPDPVTNPHDKDYNYVWDGILQEIDIETGNLLFQWRASDHVNITETYRPVWGMGNRDDPFDWFHINSIQKDELGNYLISARYPHSLYYIDGRTKQTVWVIGGKENNFMDLSGGSATNFAWQHDARFHPTDTFPNLYTPPHAQEGVTTKLLTLFDNAAEDQHYDYGLSYSRGLLLEITYPTPGTEMPLNAPDKTTHRAIDVAILDAVPSLNMQKMMSINGTDPNYTIRLIKSYENADHVRSSSQGNLQLLPQGQGKDPKVLVGYGLNAVWTEFDALGNTLCDAHYGAKTSWERGDVQSYRVYKFPWVGRPRWQPSVRLSDDDLLIFVSWLGATEVAEWVLQSSTSRSEIEQNWANVISVTKIGFETAMIVPRDLDAARYLRVVAEDEYGRRLEYGISPIMDRGFLASHFPSLSRSVTRPMTRLMSSKLFLILVGAAFGLLLVYGLLRRCLGWRLRKAGGGSARWRNGRPHKGLYEA